MTFKKGASGNARGRPKSYESMADLLRQFAAEPYGGSLTHKERIAQMVVQQAARGQPWAIEFFVNRTDGKVTEKVEQSGTVRTVIEVDYGDGDRVAD